MAVTKRKKQKKRKTTNSCFITTILLAILVVISLAATFYFLFLSPGPTLPTQTSNMTLPAEPSPSPPSPSPTETRAAAPEPPPPPPPASLGPDPPILAQKDSRIAIIIDDIGNSQTIAEQIIALNLPFAFSVLPHSPHANHLATLAKARGRDILLHIPMEASDPKWVSGPGTLLLSMSKDELIKTINHDLDAPYHPIGVNNHMGSKFCVDPVAMRVFLNVIKSKGLFFIDSLTAINSVGFTLAQDLGVKAAKRDVFLDNDQDLHKILAQIDKLITLARHHGSAIGIGHPHPATLEALRTSQTRLTQEVTMVPIHELVK